MEPYIVLFFALVAVIVWAAALHARIYRLEVDLRARPNKADYDFVHERNWAVRHEIDVLLEHLGVRIETVHQHKVVRKLK